MGAVGSILQEPSTRLAVSKDVAGLVLPDYALLKLRKHDFNFHTFSM